MSGNLTIKNFSSIAPKNINHGQLPLPDISVKAQLQGTSSFVFNGLSPIIPDNIDVSKNYSELTFSENPLTISGENLNLDTSIKPNIKISAMDQPKFQGDFDKIKAMMIKSGIPEEKIELIEGELNKLFPSKNEFLYFELKDYRNAKVLNLQLRNADCELKYGHRGDLKFAVPSEKSDMYLSCKLVDFANTLKKSINQ